MSKRNINSPDVEIKEKDFSQIGATIDGDTFVINGFFAKGPDLEPTELTSISELDTIFGKPTNEAERYSYEAASQALSNGAGVLICKIPYENDMAGAYKVVSLNIGDTAAVASGNLEYALGVESVLPITLESNDITETQYDQILAGEAFNTVFTGAQASLADDDFVIVGDSKDVMELDDKSGLFVTIADFVEGLSVQDYLAADPTLNGITFEGSSFNFGDDELIKSASGVLSKTSVSEDLMLQFPSIAVDSAGVLKTDKMDYVTVIVGRTYVDQDNEGKIGVSILEAFAGSLDKDSISQITGESDYLANMVNSGSSYITMIRNTTPAFVVTAPGANEVYQKATAITVAPTVSFIADAANGGASSEIEKDIILSTITSGLDTIFGKLANFNQYVFRYIIDAGLSSIAMHADAAIVTPGTHGYEPATNYIEITGTGDVESWKTIVSSMVEFCERTYKFAIALVDVPRDLAISGDLKILRKTNPEATFSTVVAAKLKYLGGVNTTYGMVYSDWSKRIDSVSGTSYWCPETVEAVAAHAYTHQIAEIFDAPAGLQRGVMQGVIDIAFNPSEKEASKLYTKGFNYAKRRPNGAYTVEGQKMWTTTESALNRANVRYMFIVLERYAYDSSQKFVYQPNNQFTRTQFKDILEAPLKSLKNVEGVYDYAVVCDSSNNTDEVIAQNEMRAFIGISPTRTAEYIVITFAAVPLGANIEEYVKYS
jgi:hypothetical protein